MRNTMELTQTAKDLKEAIYDTYPYLCCQPYDDWFNSLFQRAMSAGALSREEMMEHALSDLRAGIEEKREAMAEVDNSSPIYKLMENKVGEFQTMMSVIVATRDQGSVPTP